MLLLHSGKLNFTLLPPVTHTCLYERGVILNGAIMNGAGKSQLRVPDSNYFIHFTVLQSTREPEGTGNEHGGDI